MTCNPYVYTHRDVLAGEFWAAACARCGFEGPLRTTPGLARDDMHHHEEEQQEGTE
jgi:hypothetical protein